jgi:hypothetical protein
LGGDAPAHTDRSRLGAIGSWSLGLGRVCLRSSSGLLRGGAKCRGVPTLATSDGAITAMISLLRSIGRRSAAVTVQRKVPRFSLYIGRWEGGVESDGEGG